MVGGWMVEGLVEKEAPRGVDVDDEQWWVCIREGGGEVERHSLSHRARAMSGARSRSSFVCNATASYQRY